MQLFAQIQKIVRCEEGPLFSTVFLLSGCTEHAPMWTKYAKEAGSYRWEEADKLAPKLSAHAVVIASQGTTEIQRAAPLVGETREDRVNYYRRKSHQRWKERRDAFDETKVILFQEDLERKKLA